MISENQLIEFPKNSEDFSSNKYFFVEKGGKTDISPPESHFSAVLPVSIKCLKIKI